MVRTGAIESSMRRHDDTMQRIPPLPTYRPIGAVTMAKLSGTSWSFTPMISADLNDSGRM